MAQPIFILEERDAHLSKASARRLGVYSSKNKAERAAMKAYGKLVERNGGYAPVSDDDNILLFVDEVELNAPIR
jgi:hypothetical protein